MILQKFGKQFWKAQHFFFASVGTLFCCLQFFTRIISLKITKFSIICSVSNINNLLYEKCDLTDAK